MPVLAIAHRAGNSRETLGFALAAGVDAVEADLRLDGNLLIARHERRIRFLPVYVDRWFIRLAPNPQITLDEVLEKTAGRASLFLDLKSTDIRGLDVLLAALKRSRRIDDTRVSSTYWGLLDRLRQEVPALRVHYSIGDERRLARFEERLASGLTNAAVSIFQGLLTEPRAHRLVAGGIAVFAFHVNDVERARQLIDWDVTGIISGKMSLLEEIKGLRAGR